MSGMSEGSCATCKFWEPIKGSFGICCRYPPQHCFVEPSARLGLPARYDWLFPETPNGAWCGEFRLHEDYENDEDGDNQEADNWPLDQGD